MHKYRANLPSRACQIMLWNISKNVLLFQKNSINFLIILMLLDYFLQKTWLFRLDPSLLWNYSIKQALLYTWAQKCEKIPAKRLAFQETKSWFDRLLWHWRPFSRLNFKTSPFYGGYGLPIVWLSRAIGSQNAVILMLRKLLLLEGSWGKYAIPYLLAKYAKLTLAFLFCS